MYCLEWPYAAMHNFCACLDVPLNKGKMTDRQTDRLRYKSSMPELKNINLQPGLRSMQRSDADNGLFDYRWGFWPLPSAV